ncbi:hypothetical protein [Nocardia terpenica]|uniref:Mce-associated membrane protein n=1 Tax=Nocardia terpenica TaxID=455432 RepID=A0A291RG14_9NOCA|nr:hypothetical protein [Nocardia terpenica]ATL66074.1 hypothetical protein CRH09_07485 [Nocardia terpenica]
MSNDTEPKRVVDVEETAVSSATENTAKTPRTLSIRLSTVLTAAAVVALVALSAVFGSLWLSARGQLHDRDAKAADEKHAEQVATDYALGAADINYQDVNSWVAKLKANTSPQLANKFDAVAPKLSQILVPLKWTSSANPISATVTGKTNGVYKVNVFLNTTSASAQTPDGTQTTAAYTVDVDAANGWKVTDVGGVAAALPKQ